MGLSMWIGIVTLFPQMFSSIEDFGVLGRAVKNGSIELEFFNPRDYALDNYKRVDDYSYGGGPGMVLKFETLERATQQAKKRANAGTRVILMSPQGETFIQSKAQELSSEKSLIFVCGRYEGLDQRYIDKYVDAEISIGDYVLSGGELPVMVIIDALSRQLPGVLGNSESALDETYIEGLFDYPHYTRPETIAGMRVPEELLSGDPIKVAKLRRKESLVRTYDTRPDLLVGHSLDSVDSEILREHFEKSESKLA